MSSAYRFDIWLVASLPLWHQVWLHNKSLYGTGSKPSTAETSPSSISERSFNKLWIYPWTLSGHTPKMENRVSGFRTDDLSCVNQPWVTHVHLDYNFKKKKKNNNLNGALILWVTIATNNNKKSAYFAALELEILLCSSGGCESKKQ